METKQCASCLNLLSIEYFYKDTSAFGGYKNRCKQCEKERRPSKIKRAKKSMDASEKTIRRVASTKKYEKTKSGFLMRAYRNMKSRVTGVQKLKAHIYVGLSILDKKDFYDWSLNSKEFNILFSLWENSGHKRTLTPSVDRIDSTKGYEQGNIRWITHSENSRLGTQSRFSYQTFTSTSPQSISLPPPLRKQST